MERTVFQPCPCHMKNDRQGENKLEILCLSLVRLLPFTCSWSLKCKCMFISFDCWDSSIFVSMLCNSHHLNYLKSSIPWMLTNACVFSVILFVWDLTGYTELCVEISVNTLHVKKGLLSKFITNFSKRIIQIIFKFSVFSSLPFWGLLYDTNIITNAELNCLHNNIIIQTEEDCSWFIIPYVAPILIFQRFQHMNSLSLQPKLIYLYSTLLPDNLSSQCYYFRLGHTGRRG